VEGDHCFRYSSYVTSGRACARTHIRVCDYIKGKLHLATGNESSERSGGGAAAAAAAAELLLYSFFNFGVRCIWVSTTRPGRFNPWKETRCRLYRRLSGSQRRSGRVRKISPNRDSIPEWCSRWRVGTPTELSPPIYIYSFLKVFMIN